MSARISDNSTISHAGRAGMQSCRTITGTSIVRPWRARMRHSVKSRPVSCHPDQWVRNVAPAFPCAKGVSDSRLVRVAADSSVKAPCTGSTTAGMPRSSQTDRQARAAARLTGKPAQRAICVQPAGTRPCGHPLLSMQGTQASGNGFGRSWMFWNQEVVGRDGFEPST